MTDNVSAKAAIDSLIKKSRVHLYKPIQIAEILQRHRVYNDIDLSDLQSYRTKSKHWRDVVCVKFLGRTSTSSARFQDDLFNDNAIPPNILVELGNENIKGNGIVEAYIYRGFAARFSQMSSALDYCTQNDKSSFELITFLELFRKDPGLRRSVDKIYEIVVYSLFSSLVNALEITVEVKMNIEKIDIFKEFKDFADKVLQLSEESPQLITPARIHRVGVTNAADRGLDMWSSYGLAIQIKHLSLSEELAEGIVTSISADRIVIVCKDSEEKIIISLLNQLGWKSKIQSIVTESDLINWYEKALRGAYSEQIGEGLLNAIVNQIQLEFPASQNSEISQFMNERGYAELKDSFWM